MVMERKGKYNVSVIDVSQIPAKKTAKTDAIMNALANLTSGKALVIDASVSKRFCDEHGLTKKSKDGKTYLFKQ